MEDVAAKHAQSAPAPLARVPSGTDPTLPSEYSLESVFEPPKEPFYNKVDNIPPSNDTDINSIMAVLSHLALSQNNQQYADPSLNDAIFNNCFSNQMQPDLFSNFVPEHMKNIAQAPCPSWSNQRDDNKMRGFPQLSQAQSHSDRGFLCDNLKLQGWNPWQMAKMNNRNNNLAVNIHNRSMSAQSLNASNAGLQKTSEYGFMNGGMSQNQAKQLSEQLQRGKYGSSYSSLLDTNIDNEGLLMNNNQNLLLDLLKNASAAPMPGQQTSSLATVPDLRHFFKDYPFPYIDPSYSALTLVKPASQLACLDSGEIYSRKVFVGGLPPDIDEEEILASFHKFGSVIVDWPHKAESKSYFPPKGYCFLLFDDEKSVQDLVRVCMVENSKLYWHVSSPTMKDKAVQIRPWKLSDCDFVLDGAQPLDPRKTVFVGGVPRPMRAVELAMVMSRMYGPVCYAGIDTDPDLKYPKGAGRVTFSTQQSFLSAINSRFVQLQHGDIDKRVEVKPYVLEDQICDECQGLRSGGKHAPFFCANVVCLQYYCDQCWAIVHSTPGREFHKPLVKDGADRPRTMPFRMC